MFDMLSTLLDISSGGGGGGGQQHQVYVNILRSAMAQNFILESSLEAVEKITVRKHVNYLVLSLFFITYYYYVFRRAIATAI